MKWKEIVWECVGMCGNVWECVGVTPRSDVVVAHSWQGPFFRNDTALQLWRVAFVCVDTNSADGVVHAWQGFCFV